MPPRFSTLAPVRKELRGIAQCTPAHIVDGRIRNADVAELESNEPGEIAVGFVATMSNDRPALRGALHLASHFFTDFKCPDANVGTDRHDELGSVV